jgi:NAD-dependent deacetylase
MEKIVVFTGAGVSAESGLKTFRDMGGLLQEYAIEDVASPAGWARDPAAVLTFYNERRRAVMGAEPNAAHDAIARLEAQYDVVVITQNIDDLHERAGSSCVIHVHGEIMKARSSSDPSLIYSLSKPTIELGEYCALKSQLRPDVVWFGEDVRNMEESRDHFATASRIMVVGTSLTVHPAAGLVKKAPFSAEKYFISLENQRAPYGFRFLRGSAAAAVPHVVACWLAGRKPV